MVCDCGCGCWCGGVGFFFFSSRRRHTRCALVTGVQTCALPICRVRRPSVTVRPSAHWDRRRSAPAARFPSGGCRPARLYKATPPCPVSEDRQSVVSGKSVSVRVDLGGRRLLQKKKTINIATQHSHTSSQLIQRKNLRTPT